MNKSTVAVALAVLVAGTFAHSASAQVAGFSDVPKDHWAASSVSALAGAGVIQGYSSAPLMAGAADKAGKKKAAYDGNKPVTRYELAVTLYRFAKYVEGANKQPKSKTGAMAEPKTGPEALQRLVAEGYLPKNAKFVASANLQGGGAKPVLAGELADALGYVLTKVREKQVPISKGSELDVEMPEHSH